MQILIACDKFKGTLTTAEVAHTLAQPLQAHGHKVDWIPLADGGDGTVDAAYRMGYTLHSCTVTGPLGAQVTAHWALSGDTAIIEMAQASGLVRLPHEPNSYSALHSTSYGTGELVAAALTAGARHIILSVGGSACTDGGAGMLEALGVHFLDADGHQVPPGGFTLRRVSRIDTTHLLPALTDGSVEVIVATDVTNPLLGSAGAAAVYGPQKGATPADVKHLDAALAHIASLSYDTTGGVLHEPAPEAPGTGAAGGLAFGAMTFLGARRVSGAEYMLNLWDGPAKLAKTDIVITGEGSFDEQTLSGKGPGLVIDVARQYNKPVYVVCGQSQLTDHYRDQLGLAGVLTMNDLAPLADCLDRPSEVLQNLAERLVSVLAGSAR